MANLLYGAMAGAGKAALDSMQAREQAYLEEEKQKRLLELRREQEIEMLNIQDLLNGKKIEKDLTEFGEDGVKFYNSKGDQIGARAYNPAELAAKKAKDEEAALERRLKQARITTEQAQASKYTNDVHVSNARLALDRAGGGKGRRGGKDDSTESSLAKPKTLDEAVEALRTTNPGVVKDAVKAGVPDYMIDNVAEAVLRDRELNKAKGTKYRKNEAWSFKRALDLTIKQQKQDSAL